MVVRLGFAVAAHLDCEIMIVDEVLAVGDRPFQNRAINKMRDVAAESGRTVIFVSHNLRLVQNFCNRGVVLEEGRVVVQSSIDEAIARYVDSDPNSTTSRSFPARTETPTITAVRIDPVLAARGDLRVEIDFDSPHAILPTPGIVLYGEDLSPVVGTNTRMHHPQNPSHPASQGRLICTIDQLPLHEGRYFLSVWLGDGDEDVDVAEYAIALDFTPFQRPESKPSISAIGPVNVPGRWESSTLPGSTGTEL